MSQFAQHNLPSNSAFSKKPAPRSTMDRIARLHAQLSAPTAVGSSISKAHSSSILSGPNGFKLPDVYVSRRDVALDALVYDTVLTADALAFVAELTTTFARDIEKVRPAALLIGVGLHID